MTASEVIGTLIESTLEVPGTLIESTSEVLRATVGVAVVTTIVVVEDDPPPTMTADAVQRT